MIGKIISLLLLAVIIIALTYVAIVDVEIEQENRIVSMKETPTISATNESQPDTEGNN